MNSKQKIRAIRIFKKYYAPRQYKLVFRTLANGDSYRYYNPLSTYCAIALNKEKCIIICSKDEHPIDIERGATVLDFAFILNSEIGDHYKSADVNGKPVDIDYVLQPNDTILVHKDDTPTARLE